MNLKPILRDISSLKEEFNSWDKRQKSKLYYKSYCLKKKSEIRLKLVRLLVTHLTGSVQYSYFGLLCDITSIQLNSKRGVKILLDPSLYSTASMWSKPKWINVNSDMNLTVLDGEKYINLFESLSFRKLCRQFEFK